MRNIKSKKSLADFSKNAIVTTDQLNKVKGGTGTIIIDTPAP